MVSNESHRPSGILLAMTGAMIACKQVAAAGRGFVLTEDIGVTFSASPTENLVPGQPIDFELTVTNHGDESVDFLALSSSHFVHEIVSGPSDCGLVTVVADGENFYEFWRTWYVSGAAGGAPLEAGESRTCHFQMALTYEAPVSYPFTFGLPDFFTDPNPDNDRVTLILRRGDLAPVAVPSLSAYAMLLLVAMLAIAACLGFRRFGRHA
jgi:hypothetical protein